MKFKPMFFAVFLLLVVSPSLVQGANWISVSGMVFVGDADVLMFKEDGFSSYLTLQTSYGYAWAPVNFPPNTKGKKVVRMEALVYDGSTASFGMLDIGGIRIHLVKVDLATGGVTYVMGAGTPFAQAPGLVTLVATIGPYTEIDSGEIDNKKWAWYLRCIAAAPNIDELRLYGVRIRYK